MSRFQFVADHLDTYPVKWLCALLDLERSSFYAWRAATPTRERRRESDNLLAQRIRTINETEPAWGAPRITAELNDNAAAGARVNRKKVARVMREHAITGYRRRRRIRTTIADQSHTKVPDLVKRDFTAPAPNIKYVGDITYLPLADGSNWYLATVIDCFSRKLVGWAIADHMRTELVVDALTAGADTRGSLAGAIFHSDHGSVYTSKVFAAACARLGVTQSMGEIGSSADNALAESFNAALKREVLQDEDCWPDADTCQREVFAWLVRYNTRRRHSWCGQASPDLYEKRCAATLSAAA